MLNTLPSQFPANILRCCWQSHCKFLLLTLIPVVLTTPALAQMNGEALPPAPFNQDTYYSVPRVNNGDGRTFDYQAPNVNQSTQYNQTSIYQYNQSAERFSVFVDSGGYNVQLLPVVKRVEPSAYIRSFGGRAVIQAGIFSRQQNAVLRIQQLLATGINLNNLRLFNLTSGQELALTPANGGGNNPGGNPNQNQQRSNYYYVAIPAPTAEFPAIETRIQSSLGQSLNNVSLLRRNSPRGTHIAVGPFAERSQAEKWNAAIKDAGLSNARVYYGK
ncbi:SPOR domain-containing protein [Calothrix sp. UHCC 0171]|uniref:SPOR domain-containing protein n=1 Tax=Calothrix sp. UHCC 0171 TaxID=3110245 RepID=UPI002B1FDFE1|nr:SPOR domain-containing protein [Calothrix sp. UHCC 0171]MEA5571737.1 SPOR domain-containing protein [Calothrix sp. UHCC 0171]